MKKIQHAAFSGILLLALSLGLAGCGNSQSSAKSSSSSTDKVAKVTKAKKSTKASSSATKASDKDGADGSTNETSNTDANNNSANSTAPTNKAQSSSTQKYKAASTKQLGLSDVAVWTDSKGITHHVDSDGMDRQTSNGQSGTTYQDWSGPLPDSAQIIQQK